MGTESLSAPASIVKRRLNAPPNTVRIFLRDLQDGQAVDAVFLVKDRRLSQKRNGEDFLRLTVCDNTGSRPAVCWDNARDVHDVAEPGSAVRIRAQYAVSDRFGPQLTVKSLTSAGPDEYELTDLLDGPPMNIEQMEIDLRHLIETVRNPYLSTLLDGLFGERSEVWRRFRSAPAAKFYHQAYAHGLLEHTLTVGQAVSAVSASFGAGVDRDLAVTGALMHDIGKIEAYGSDPTAIDLTDDGKLLGEIPLGYYLVRREIETIEGFPWELARALLHIILSHHGTLENGSPVMPCTREATLVHAIDNLGGKLGSFDRLQKDLPEGEAWSRFDKALGGGAYFATNGASDSNGEPAAAPSREHAPDPRREQPAASNGDSAAPPASNGNLELPLAAGE
jgi:3'-5' exoribonuclease